MKKTCSRTRSHTKKNRNVQTPSFDPIRTVPCVRACLVETLGPRPPGCLPEPDFATVLCCPVMSW